MQPDLSYLMKQALIEAKKGASRGEVPVGAVVANSEGHIIARAYNSPITLQDPTAHAEILALREACLIQGSYRLRETMLVVTIEPCVMCMGAAIHARVERLVFGAYDPKGGAAGSLYNMASDGRLNHMLEVVPGIMDGECRGLLQDFFRARRPKRS